MPGHTDRPRFHESRPAAVVLVILSGITIFHLSLALQVFAWELRPLLNARFGFGEHDLPKLTAVFVDLFGYRPDAHLTFVVWWFWWPMVASLGYCHIQYREPREFSAAFLFALVFCWLIFLCFVSSILSAGSMPFIILLSELHEPPTLASLIVPISWILPLGTIAFLTITWRRRLKETSQN